LRSAAALLHGTPAAGVGQTLWRGRRNGITEPSIFGRLPSRWASSHVVVLILVISQNILILVTSHNIYITSVSALRGKMQKGKTSILSLSALLLHCQTNQSLA